MDLELRTESKTSSVSSIVPHTSGGGGGGGVEGRAGLPGGAGGGKGRAARRCTWKGRKGQDIYFLEKRKVLI